MMVNKKKQFFYALFWTNDCLSFLLPIINCRNLVTAVQQLFQRVMRLLRTTL